MVELALFTLILIINNGGGDGKTTWSETLDALARLAGLRSAVLDVDPGLRGYSHRNGAEAADRLGWDGEFDNGRDLAGWLDGAMSQDITVVDTGANLISADKQVSHRLQEIVTHVHDHGGRLVIHAVTSPNKAGSDQSVEDLYEIFSSHAEFAVIKNRRDGSDLFGEKIDMLPVPKVEVPYISPGLQGYRLRRQVPLDKIITDPQPGFSQASKRYAEHLRQIAKSDHIASIVGKDVAFKLLALSGDLKIYEAQTARTV